MRECRADAAHRAMRSCSDALCPSVPIRNAILLDQNHGSLRIGGQIAMVVKAHLSAAVGDRTHLGGGEAGAVAAEAHALFDQRAAQGQTSRPALAAAVGKAQRAVAERPDCRER